LKRALKVRNIERSYSALSELAVIRVFELRGDALRCAQRLPLAVMFRAFGAAVVATQESFVVGGEVG
jgi:hypothetical protein